MAKRILKSTKRKRRLYEKILINRTEISKHIIRNTKINLKKLNTNLRNFNIQIMKYKDDIKNTWKIIKEITIF